MILQAIFITVVAVPQTMTFLEGLEFILIPGLIGFMAIIMLFALRITRYLTKK
jgi:hypothetical protein